MLLSLCCWLRLSGVPGIAFVLDIRQLARTGAAVGDGLKYSPAAVMDAFEVLRQVIDDADRFEGLFLAVLAEETFVDSDRNTKRSDQCYTALTMRISSTGESRVERGCRYGKSSGGAVSYKKQ